ncbi:MAG: TIGR02466 family protein [Rhizomicrobium sp.]
MARIDSVFATQIYRAQLTPDAELERACLALARDDLAGRRWAKAHGYRGYTSYASLDDLPERMPEFAALNRTLDRHVATFARALDFELGRRRLALDSLWVNVMASGGVHGGHIHPHSAISGTFYVALPPGSSAIKFEDPRLPLMMAAPVRKQTARAASRTFISIAPKPGMLLLWESWLRHEVPQTAGRGRRISISFNYR